MLAIREVLPSQPVREPLLPINLEPRDPYAFLGQPVVVVSQQDQVAHQSQAIEALDQATYKLSNGPKYADELEIDVAATAAQMGLADYRVLQRLVYPAPILGRTIRKEWQWSDIANIAAYIGDDDKAFEYARRASRKDLGTRRFDSTYPYYLAADVIAARGGDVRVFLDEAEKTAKIVEKAEREDGDGQFLDLRATEQISLAMALRRHGHEFEQVLDNAAKLILEKGSTGWAYERLARAYAATGRFDEALLAVGSIVDSSHPENTEPHRRKTIGQIAIEMFEFGQHDRAIQLVQDAGVWSIASLLAMKKGYLMAQSGKNPSDALDEGIVAAEKLDADRETLLGCIEERRVTAYSVAGRILALAGHESEPKFIEAQNHTEAEANWEAGKSYWRIIQDMFASGYDVTDLFESAMRLSDRRSTAFSLFYPIWRTAMALRRLEYEDLLMGKLEADRVKYRSWEHSQWSNAYEIRFLIRKALTLGQPMD